jgi:hypothetical protein
MEIQFNLVSRARRAKHIMANILHGCGFPNGIRKSGGQRQMSGAWGRMTGVGATRACVATSIFTGYISWRIAQVALLQQIWKSKRDVEIGFC